MVVQVLHFMNDTYAISIPLDLGYLRVRTGIGDAEKRTEPESEP